MVKLMYTSYIKKCRGNISVTPLYQQSIVVTVFLATVEVKTKGKKSQKRKEGRKSLVQGR